MRRRPQVVEPGPKRRQERLMANHGDQLPILELNRQPWAAG